MATNRSNRPGVWDDSDIAHVSDTGRLGRPARTETVDNNETITIHAEKNQDIEVENDETHFASLNAPRINVWDDTDIVHVSDDDGPSHLLGDLHARVANSPAGASQFWGDDNGHIPFEQLKTHHITGDWNGDGPDTLGIGDANGDGMVDAADYVV